MSQWVRIDYDYPNGARAEKRGREDGGGAASAWRPKRRESLSDLVSRRLESKQPRVVGTVGLRILIYASVNPLASWRKVRWH